VGAAGAVATAYACAASSGQDREQWYKGVGDAVLTVRRASSCRWQCLWPQQHINSRCWSAKSRR